MENIKATLKPFKISFFHILLSLFITISTLSVEPVYAQENINILSLNDVIYLAQQQSPDALIAKHRFRRSYWEYRTFKANYLPQLRADAIIPNFNRSIEIVTLPNGVETFQAKSFSNASADISLNQKVGALGGEIFLRSGLSRLDNFTDSTTLTSWRANPINIGYSQPIFKYNPYKWDRKIEPIKYTQSQSVYLENMEQVAIIATNYFFNLLLAQTEKSIAHKNMHNYDTLYRIAMGRYNLGKIAENELLQLELNYLRATAAVENAELALQNNRFRLKSYLRVKDDVQIELIPPTDTYHFPVDAATAIGEAKENSSTSLDFEVQLLEAASQVNLARRSNRFEAELYAVFGLTGTNDMFSSVYNEPLDQEQVSLGLHIPIVDWGVAKGNIKMAESSEELVMTSVEQERIDFEQNIFLTVMQFNMQENQLMIAAKSDTVAQKRYDVTQRRYVIGKVNDVLELNNAQIDNDNAKKSYFQALQTYWRNFYELRRLTLFDFRQNQKIEFNLNDIGYID
ncbi:MAG: TolC family protein [Bacteroidota bacterium]|nr:TolC family protein [Bacteroidota bacterium]